MQDNLGDRMKAFEDAFRAKLPIRMPVILRLDGKAFHTLTKNLKRPFDLTLINAMNDTAKYLCANVQGAQIAYVQSDEITILLNNYKSFDTQPWFENNIQKMVSVSAAMASAYFSSISNKVFDEPKLVTFDCRAFVIPKEDVNNAFLWRQNDATRNSIQMLARSLYSHKECNNKNTSQLQEMCFQKGFNWNDLPTSQRRGRCIVKVKSPKEVINKQTQEKLIVERSSWEVDNDIPIFSYNFDYVNQYV